MRLEAGELKWPPRLASLSREAAPILFPRLKIPATIQLALVWAAKKLKQEDNNAPELDAEVLLSFVLKKDKTFLFAYPEKILAKKQIKAFKKLITRRARRWPVSYLTGEKEFYGYKFKITPDTLAPRPLTEEIVSLALKFIKTQNKPLAIADIGTGSACIVISLIKELQKHRSLKGWQFFATDISKKALKIASQNARHHQVSKYIKFHQGNLLKPLAKTKIDLLLVNLPYLTKKDFKKEKSIQKEPRLALIGNLYPKLFKQASGFKNCPAIIYEDKAGVHQKNSSRE